jgi:hypothetical protein
MFLVLHKDYNEGYYRGVWHHKNEIKIESTEQVDVFSHHRYFACKITKYLKRMPK